MAPDQKMFDSLRNVTNASKDTNVLNHTGSFLATVNEANNRSMFTDPGNNSSPTPQTGKITNKSSFVSSN